jgi:hypothetical protein
VILLLRHDASDADVANLRQRLDELGFESSRLDDARGRALEAHGEHLHELATLRSHPAVEDLLASEPATGEVEPLWPHGVLQLSILLTLIGVVLLVLLAIAPAGLGDRADLTTLPQTEASEWYLRPLATLLHTIPSPVGGIVVLLLWIGLVFWPFLDRPREPRRHALLIRIMGIVLIVALITFALIPLP